MNNKSLESATGSQSSSSDHEGDGRNAGKRKRGPAIKKRIKEQKFVIYCHDLNATLSELHTARRRSTIRRSTEIPLHDSMSEEDVRSALEERLPQLKGTSYKFFTKGKQGKHFCPCSTACVDPAHSGENIFAKWNGKNIKKMAKGHKVVYIHCKESCLEERSVGSVPNSSSTLAENGALNDSVSVSTHTHLAGGPVTERLLPELAIATDPFPEEEIAKLDLDMIANLHIDNLEIPNLIDDIDSLQDENEQSFPESTWANRNECRTIPAERTATITTVTQDSAYETLHTGSTTTIFPAMEAQQNEQITPLLLSTPSFAGSMNTPGNQERTRAVLSLAIVEIAPTEGSLKGGYNFLITLDTAVVNPIGELQVLFGTVPAELVSLAGDGEYVKGKVPRSLTTGVVEVRVLDPSGGAISTNTVPFEYTDPKDKLKEERERRRKRKNYLDGEVTSSEDCLEMMSLLLEKLEDFQLNSNGGTSCDGTEKTRALSYLRMIVETAAKINAMEFFTIIFSTSVGRNVFKSFKHEELLLEEVAREYGHEELACFLEERHLMYRQDESDSDDEVDWASLAKAVKECQRQKAGREISRSTGSSEDSFDYHGDVEDCLSVFSESDRVVETLSIVIFEEQQTNCYRNDQKVPQEEEEEEDDDDDNDNDNDDDEEEGLWISRPTHSLPDLAYSPVGGDRECEEIIAKLSANQFRVGVIYGSLETLSKETFEEQQTNCYRNDQKVPQEEEEEEEEDDDDDNDDDDDDDDDNDNDEEEGVWISRPTHSLPDLAYSPVGRDRECEEIIAKLSANQFRVGVIYGSLGIGKTSVALEVGHILQSKGWTINYHVCSDLVQISEMSTLFPNFCEVSNSATHLKNDKGNETFPVKESNPALLILDQVDNLIDGDQSALVSKSLQQLVDTALEASSVRLLLVSRESMRLTDGLAFHVKLEPLCDAAAIQLLQIASQISSERNLEVIAKGCGCNPLALTIVLNLIHKGMPETDIISEMSSPEHFWKKLFYSVAKCHLLKGEETKRGQKDCLNLSLSSLLKIQNTVQIQMFLESWMEDTNCLNEEKVFSYEKEFDLRYCRCRLCTSSDRNKSLKLALSSSASLTDSQKEKVKKEARGVWFSKPLIQYSSADEQPFAGSSMSDEVSSGKKVEKSVVEDKNTEGVSIAWKNSCVEVDVKIAASPTVLEEVSNSKKRRCVVVVILCGLLSSAGLLTTARILALTSGGNATLKAANPCTEAQFWLVNADGTTSCKDCESCPPGQGLSHKCGTRISSNAMVNCVPCQGAYFSSEYDTSSCIPCASCSEDQVVLQNCTPTMDVNCSKKCYGKDRYYDDIGGCLPCSKCCGSGQDVEEDECKQKLGAASNTICSFHSSVKQCDAITAIPKTITSVINTSSLTSATISTGGIQDSPDPTIRRGFPSSAALYVAVPVAGFVPLLLIAGCLSYFRYAKQKRRNPRLNIYDEMGCQSVEPSHPLPLLLDGAGLVSHEISATESHQPLLREESVVGCSCQENTSTTSTATGQHREQKTKHKVLLPLRQLKPVSIDACLEATGQTTRKIKKGGLQKCSKRV